MRGGRRADQRSGFFPGQFLRPGGFRIENRQDNPSGEVGLGERFAGLGEVAHAHDEHILRGDFLQFDPCEGLDRGILAQVLLKTGQCPVEAEIVNRLAGEVFDRKEVSRYRQGTLGQIHRPRRVGRDFQLFERTAVFLLDRLAVYRQGPEKQQETPCRSEKSFPLHVLYLSLFMVSVLFLAMQGPRPGGFSPPPERR